MMYYITFIIRIMIIIIIKRVFNGSWELVPQQLQSSQFLCISALW